MSRRPIKDFTLSKYRELLTALRSYDDVILRHDVDKKPENSLEIAKIEASMGRKAIYYFRAKKCSLNEDIVRDIAALGHEIGYHYESLTTCNGNIDEAWKDFQKNLEKLRSIAPVHSACMHGSPKSKWDSRDIWKKYDYRSVGIDFEPYLDTDFGHTFYLTDTGRRWDGWRSSVRDKIPEYQEIWEAQGLSFSDTDELVFAARAHSLPESIMITTHPQRWTDNEFEWLWELFSQNLKNLIKRRRINGAAPVAKPDFGAAESAAATTPEAALEAEEQGALAEKATPEAAQKAPEQEAELAEEAKSGYGDADKEPKSEKATQAAATASETPQQTPAEEAARKAPEQEAELAEEAKSGYGDADKEPKPEKAELKAEEQEAPSEEAARKTPQQASAEETEPIEQTLF